MKATQKLGLEEHQKLAEQLMIIFDSIDSICNTLSGKAPVRIIDTALKLGSAANNLQMKLEDDLYNADRYARCSRKLYYPPDRKTALIQYHYSR
jgi:hypothetical protein